MAYSPRERQRLPLAIPRQHQESYDDPTPKRDQLLIALFFERSRHLHIVSASTCVSWAADMNQPRGMCVCVSLLLCSGFGGRGLFETFVRSATCRREPSFFVSVRWASYKLAPFLNVFAPIAFVTLALVSIAFAAVLAVPAISSAAACATAEQQEACFFFFCFRMALFLASV